MDKNKLYYLASPYSHDNTFIKQFRYEAVIYTGSMLTKMGHTLIEPIAMCHEQSLRHELPGGYAFWKARDRNFISISDGIIVLTLPGWDDSVGVLDEIEWAKELGIEVHYLDPLKMWPQEVIDQLPGGVNAYI